jgi:S-adenosylmethionine uptake transporter
MTLTRGSLWMLVAAFGFAAMGVCVKFAAASHSVGEIVLYRSLIALVVSGALLKWQGLKFATPEWKLQAYRGLSGFVSLLAYFSAIALLPLATAVTLNYTSPLFFALLLWSFGGVPWRPAFSLTLLAGFVGVGWLLQPTLQGEQWFGGVIGLFSGAVAGLAYFNVRALGARGEPVARTVFYFSLVSTLGALAWMGFSEFSRLDLRSGLLMLGVGLFATAAQLAMTRAYKHGDALLSASLAYSAVIFASLFGIVFWQETLRPDAWGAIALITASGIAATVVSRRSSRKADVLPFSEAVPGPVKVE